MTRLATRLLAALLGMAATAARADTTGLDAPLSVTDASAGTRCTTYADFTIRQSGLDTPAPDGAVLVRGTRPACNAQGTRLDTGAFALVGRKGAFLLFEAVDPNGASAFKVIDAGSGRAIYADGLRSGGIRAVAIENGALRIAFTRAMNLACSLPKDGASCWAKSAVDRKIPPSIAQTPAPVQPCIDAYQHDHVAASDPSTIFYDVDMLLAAGGKPQVLSRGPVGCYPQP